MVVADRDDVVIAVKEPGCYDFKDATATFEEIILARSHNWSDVFDNHKYSDNFEYLWQASRRR